MDKKKYMSLLFSKSYALSSSFKKKPQKWGSREGIIITLIIINNNKKTKQYKGSIFFVTVPLNGNSQYLKSEFLEYCKLYSVDNKLSHYCISIENYDVSEMFIYHLHAFLEYTEKLSVDLLKLYLKRKYPHNIDVASCRRKKSTIVYITKFDTSPLLNVSSSQLNFNYRLHTWAKNTTNFKITDPFIAAHESSCIY